MTNFVLLRKLVLVYNIDIIIVFNPIFALFSSDLNSLQDFLQILNIELFPLSFIIFESLKRFWSDAKFKIVILFSIRFVINWFDAHTDCFVEKLLMNLIRLYFALATLPISNHYVDRVYKSIKIGIMIEFQKVPSHNKLRFLMTHTYLCMH